MFALDIVVIGLTAASLVCVGAAVALRAAPKRVVPAAVAMTAAALDMHSPGSLLAPMVWGGLLLFGSILLLVGRASPAARPEIAWHAGSLLTMAGMWFAMAGDAPTQPSAGAAEGGHGGNAGLVFGVPLPWAIGATAVLLAVVAITGQARHGAREARGSRLARWASWRHSLMAVGMVLMALAMPIA